MDPTRTRCIYPRLNDYYTLLLPSVFASDAEFFRSPIDTKQHLTLIMAKHVTFGDMKFANPSFQRKKLIEIRQKQCLNQTDIEYKDAMKSITYHPEYAKKSFYQITHFKDNNKYIAHSLTLNIRLNPKTMRPGLVEQEIQNLCDNTWNNHYPKDLKLKYNALKTELTDNISFLNTNYKNSDNTNNDSILFSHRVQFRFSDQDILSHINHVSDFKFIEECLLNFDKKIKSKQKIIYSISAVFWKVITVKKYKFCYVILRNKKEHIMDNKYKAIDYNGTISICKKCCKSDTNICVDGNHEFMNQRGFVVRVVNKKPIKPSKL